MKKTYTKAILTLSFLTIIFSSSHAQVDCSAGDLTEFLEDTSITQEVRVFATKINTATNMTEALELTVFSPANYPNNTKRPVMMLSHGGAFIGGERESMAVLGERFARMGYVAVTHDYRLTTELALVLGGITRFYEAAAGATDDLLDAVNYLKTNSEEFNIDTNNIVLAGGSAGAIMDLHLAYVDTEDSLSGTIRGIFENFSNVLSADKSSFKAVLNLSGAILDTTWLINNDIPVFSIHGDMDDVVPYAEGNAVGLIPMFGSATIHEILEERGIQNNFVSVPGGGHSDIYDDSAFASYIDTFLRETNMYLSSILCDPTTSSSDELSIDDQMSVYPNPFYDHMTVISSTPLTRFVIYDALGRNMGVVTGQDVNGENTQLDLSHLKAGTYILTSISDNGSIQSQIITKSF